MKRLLVANRGEIAVRILRAAAELGVRTVAVYSADDAASLHVRRADEASALAGTRRRRLPRRRPGRRAAPSSTGCDAVHPGYGFLTENAAFARRCAEPPGSSFVGPSPEVLELFGDKAAARRLARALRRAGAGRHRRPHHARGGRGVPRRPRRAVARDDQGGRRRRRAGHAGGDAGPRTSSAALRALPLGGARPRSATATSTSSSCSPTPATSRCRSSATAAARSTHLGERECSLQRRHQKLVEIAPSPALDAGLRDRLLDAAVRLAGEVDYAQPRHVRVPRRRPPARTTIAFIEANARLQVEHTVTEEVTGVDLVASCSCAWPAAPRSPTSASPRPRCRPPRRRAVQVRVNTETMDADGTARPAGGTLTAFERAVRARRARRHLRLRRLHDQPALRLAAGQGHRPRRQRRLRRRGRPGPAGRSASSASRAWRPTPAFLRAVLGPPRRRSPAARHHASLDEPRRRARSPRAAHVRRRPAAGAPSQPGRLAGARVDAARPARRARPRQAGRGRRARRRPAHRRSRLAVAPADVAGPRGRRRCAAPHAGHDRQRRRRRGRPRPRRPAGCWSWRP